MKILLIALLFINLYSSSISEEANSTSTKQEYSIDEPDFDDDFDDEFDDEFDSEFDNEFDSEQNGSSSSDSDFFEGYNRVVTDFNDYFYLNIFNPISKGYNYIMPDPAQKSISNFFSNLGSPIRFANSILQLKVEKGFDELSRFVINSTLGIFGLFDVANSWFDIKKSNEDFGQTLGFYGVGEGAYIVLPFLGPTTLRDSMSFVTDSKVNLEPYMVSSMEEYIAMQALKHTNRNSLNLGLYESLKKDSIDWYISQREICRQRRQKAIDE
jgi:phospholipid-binding lipoprotein MlaA